MSPRLPRHGFLFPGITKLARKRVRRKDGSMGNAHTSLVKAVEDWAAMRSQILMLARSPAGVYPLVPRGRDGKLLAAHGERVPWLYCAPPGWSDLTGFAVRCGHVVAVEVKLAGDSMSPEQREFQRVVIAAGGHHFVARAINTFAEECERVLRDCGKESP